MTTIRIRKNSQPKPSDAVINNEAADEREWEAQFAATTDEKLNKLTEVVQAKIRAGKVLPLNFDNK